MNNELRKISEVRIGGYSLEEIIKRHQHWISKDCMNYKNMKANFKGLSLTNIDFSGLNLRGITFRDADLTGSNFTDANVSECLFINANLTNTIFVKANMEKTIFGAHNNRNLQCNAILDNVDFSKAYCKNTVFSFCKRIRNCKFIETNLTGSKFSDIDIAESTLCNTIGEYYMSGNIWFTIFNNAKCKLVNAAIYDSEFINYDNKYQDIELRFYENKIYSCKFA